MELAIDTSTETAGLALGRRGRLLAELSWRSGLNHTRELLPNLQHLLEGAGVSPQELTGLVVAIGPGSFNGLRAGIGTAKGLALSLGVPLVGVGTLAAEGYQHAGYGLPVCAASDAQRNELAAAVYHAADGRWQPLLAEHITTAHGLASRLPRPVVVCGELPEEAEATLRRELGVAARFVSGAATLRRAGYLLELGWRRLAAGEADNPATLEPIYLRRPPIHRGAQAG